MHRAENRHVSLDPHIAQALDRWVEADRRRRETVRQLQEALTPAGAERRLGHVVSRHTAHTTGIEAGLIHLEHTEQTHKIEEALYLLHTEPQPPVRWQHRSLDVAQPPGPMFWWVRTDCMHTDHFNVETLGDGLRVTGGLNGEPPRHWLESATPLRAELEVVSFFLVDTQEVEWAVGQQGVSRPLLTLRGDLIANTTREFMPGARSSTECRLHLSHRLFHVDTDAEKAEPVVLGEAHEGLALLMENNTGRARREPLPGTVTAPGVPFHDLDTDRTLWARTDIRVDLQVEGAGNLLWFDPALEVTLDQWSVKADSSAQEVRVLRCSPRRRTATAYRSCPLHRHGGDRR